MDETGAALGGETSGHILLAPLSPAGDGILTALVVASIVRSSGRRLSELATLDEDAADAAQRPRRAPRPDRGVPRASPEPSPAPRRPCGRGDGSSCATRAPSRCCGSSSKARMHAEVHALADELEAVGPRRARGMKGVRAVLFDAGGTLIHVDGERVCRAAASPSTGLRFGGAEAEAVGAVRALVLERPESRDAERLPLYLDTLLTGPRPRRRKTSAGAAAGQRRRRARPREPLVAARGRIRRDARRACASRGYRVAVVSNADGRVRGLLEAAGLAPLLEFVVDSAEVGRREAGPPHLPRGDRSGSGSRRPSAPTSATSTRSTSSGAERAGLAADPHRRRAGARGHAAGPRPPGASLPLPRLRIDSGAIGRLSHPPAEGGLDGHAHDPPQRRRQEALRRPRLVRDASRTSRPTSARTAPT